MKWLVLFIVLGVAAGVGYWAVHNPKEAMVRELAMRRALVHQYDQMLAAIKDGKDPGPPPKLDGAYDGSSYNTRSDIEGAKDEQTRRIKDLQDRLDSAYGK